MRPRSVPAAKLGFEVAEATASRAAARSPIDNAFRPSRLERVPPHRATLAWLLTLTALLLSSVAWGKSERAKPTECLVLVAVHVGSPCARAASEAGRTGAERSSLLDLSVEVDGDGRSPAGAEGASEHGFGRGHARAQAEGRARAAAPQRPAVGASKANLYVYVGGDPVNSIDPSGEIWWAIAIGAIEGAAVDAAIQYADRKSVV